MKVWADAEQRQRGIKSSEPSQRVNKLFTSSKWSDVLYLTEMESQDKDARWREDTETNVSVTGWTDCTALELRFSRALTAQSALHYSFISTHTHIYTPAI